MTNLYLVENSGEATSSKLMWLTNEELNTIIKVFSNMNRPFLSPSVYIYLLKEEDIKEIDDEDSIDEDKIFKLDNKNYTWADEYFYPYFNAKVVFDEERGLKFWP